jgi:predicted TIM-barrel fold metal-dependent hydrolase
MLASPLLFGVDMLASSLRDAFDSARYQALAEFAPQFSGLAPDAVELDPVFALAEELDVPMGIYMGLGPPGITSSAYPDFRMMHSNALLLEDVLVRHPKLRLYVMHAGWPLLDEMVALMHAFPDVHVDISVLNWYLPKKEFYSYLQRLVDAEFSKRIMFGSDQMVWPDAIGRAIETVESAPFLSDEQRRDIMCGNAMRFLRLDERICQ